MRSVARRDGEWRASAEWARALRAGEAARERYETGRSGGEGGGFGEQEVGFTVRSDARRGCEWRAHRSVGSGLSLIECLRRTPSCAISADVSNVRGRRS